MLGEFRQGKKTRSLHHEAAGFLLSQKHLAAVLKRPNADMDKDVVGYIALHFLLRSFQWRQVGGGQYRRPSTTLGGRHRVSFIRRMHCPPVGIALSGTRGNVLPKLRHELHCMVILNYHTQGIDLFYTQFGGLVNLKRHVQF